MLDLGLRAGEDNRDNSSMMPQLRGWFLGNSLRRCSKEYRRRSSFWLDSLKRAWACKQGWRLEKKAKREEREDGWKWMETLVTWHFFPFLPGWNTAAQRDQTLWREPGSYNQACTSEWALFSVTLPDPRSFITFLAPSATADSILAWWHSSSTRRSNGLMMALSVQKGME